MFLKFISSHILEYRRLRIELDLIDSNLGDKYPIVKIITKHLRDPLCDIKQLEEENRKLKERLGNLYNIVEDLKKTADSKRRMKSEDSCVITEKNLHLFLKGAKSSDSQ